MIDANSPKPLYEQIKDYILHNIDIGEFEPDGRIPSERDLSKLFGVSRLTVNKAVRELTQAGVLYVRIGKGTFISSETFDQELDVLSSFSEEMQQRGRKPYSRVLDAEIMPASAEIARQLRLLVGVEVVLLKRLRMADGLPVALETSVFPAAACPDIFERHDFTHESLYDVLRKQFNVHLVRAEQTFEARRASYEDCDLLKVEEGSPILYIQRITYTDSDTPFEYVRSFYRGDRYKFRAVLRRI